jgi:murein DD-endopeptidase MepM/ murein hydrolase activator NlpD
MMNARKTLIILATGIFLIASPAYAATVYYQPTPYPSNITTGVHVWDGWITDYYYGKTFVRDDRLLQGGWGDTYRTYVRFDTKGLPTNASRAVLWMWPYAVTNAMAVNFNLVTSSWGTSMTWDTTNGPGQPSATLLGSRGAPTLGQWWGTTITPWYNAWASNPATNYGFRLDPVLSNNDFNAFIASRYASVPARPQLQLDFTSPVTVPNFVMPLPGNLSWLVTTEIGGWDCKGTYDEFHDDVGNNFNYFSIDFSRRNKNSSGSQQYSESDNIPVIAAAGGKVIVATSVPDSLNGYYVVIDHDSDGNINTGFTTRYLHLKDRSLVTVNQVVIQGDSLGYMGNTGLSKGMHLHFGTRYNNSGVANGMAQYVINNGLILKSYQSECLNNDWNKYYLSSNRVY